MQRVFLFLSIVFFFSQCAPSRYIRPLAEKEHAVTANLGGPLIGFAGTTIPVPLSSVGYGYGLNNKTTLFGSVHTTALLYGTLQTDIGVCRSVAVIGRRMLFSGNAVVNAAVSKWDGQGRIWPQLDLNLSYSINSNGSSFIYAGLGNWFELSSKRAHEQKQAKHVFLNPQIGVQLTRRHWDYRIELKGLALGVPNQPNVVDYKGIGGNGAIGVYFGITRRFGKASNTAQESTSKTQMQ